MPRAPQQVSPGFRELLNGSPWAHTVKTSLASPIRLFQPVISLDGPQDLGVLELQIVLRYPARPSRPSRKYTLAAIGPGWGHPEHPSAADLEGPGADP